MTLALFDFDGTITDKDSLVEFIQYAVGKPRYILGLIFLSPMLISYKLKLIPNHKAKQILISYFFKNWSKSKFTDIANKYSKTAINLIIRENALKKINWHKEKGHQVVVVSASMEMWLALWCKDNGLELIGTKLEVKNSLITGKFASPNCYGIEKEIRIKKAYDLRKYQDIYAYGDSAGDKQLLALANKSFYKPFRG